MFRTLATLINGANARAEDRVRDAFAIELIDQKIREAEARLKSAKMTLATMIQRHASETRQLAGLTRRIDDLTARATEALAAGREDLAAEAAEIIAQLENERDIRTGTIRELDERSLRLRASVEAGHRRIVDLKQGAIQARAVRREQLTQAQLRSTIGDTSAVDEAEELIARVLGRDDPFEQSEILRDIDRGLSGDTIASRMADQGFGPAPRATGRAVLERLKSART